MALYFKNPLQQPVRFQICDSQRLHFGVTTATSLLSTKPLLLRRGSSSRRNVRILGIPARKPAKSAFYEVAKAALQTLHFYLNSNESKDSKGFEMLRHPKMYPNLLQNVTTFETKRNKSVTNRLLQGWQRISADCNVCNAIKRVQHFLPSQHTQS